MAGFSADWLALREPADHAARSAALTHSIADVLAEEAAPSVLDLAAGTGSNFRFLSPVLPRGRWLLVDHDRELLARVPPDPRVETREMDLSHLDDPSIFDGRALVTA